jgi:thioredoxin 1
MKKLGYLLASVLIMLAISCKGQIGKNSNDINTQAVKDNSEVSGNTITTINDAPVHINKADFLQLVMDYEKNPDTWSFKGKIPCLIDFYADWCAPCRITSPILEELAKEYTGKINIYKIDVDEERELASVFGIQNIPTFLFCPMKGNPTISSGIANSPDATRDMFRQQIEKILLNSQSETDI